VFDGFFDGVDGSAEEVGVTHFVSVVCLLSVWRGIRRRASGQRALEMDVRLEWGCQLQTHASIQDNNAVRDENMKSN
jgi:hypothetical protein